MNMNKSCTSTWWSLNRECFGIFQYLWMLWSSLSIGGCHLDCPEKKKNNSADICCNEANDLTSFFWLALGPTLQNQQTKQHCKPSGPVASHPHYVQKDLSKTIQSFLGRSRSFAEETTLPTFTLRFFSSPSITFPLMHEVSPNQWSAPFCMSHSCILMALSILTDSTEDDMSAQSGTRFQPRSPKACLVSWKVTNLWTTRLPSPRDGLNLNMYV